MCNVKACSVKELIRHYNDFHDKDFQQKRKTFKNRDDFESWKGDIEKETSSEFVKERGIKRKKSWQTDFYYCNRSANKFSERLTPTENRKRAERVKGTSKIKGKCTSFMTVTTLETAHVVVDFCLDHVGHEIQLCYLNLSSDLRSFIAAMLASGIQINTILNDIRDRMKHVDRDTLVTRKDIIM